MILSILRSLAIAASSTLIIFPTSSSCTPLGDHASGIWSMFGLKGRAAENVTAAMDFVWPIEREWYSEYQTVGPCGTNATVGDRTDFPLDSAPLSLVLALDSYSVVLRVAYGNDPTTQQDFTTVILDTEQAKLAAGMRCYTAPDFPSNVTAGTNATVQMEYVSHWNGSVYQNYYACADITFVENADFTASVNCMNETVSETSPNGVQTSSASTTSTTSSSSSSSSSSSGLSKGAKAGIAVGCIAGCAALIGVLFFALMRRKRSSPVMGARGRGIGKEGEDEEGDGVRLNVFKRLGSEAPSAMSRQTGR